MMGSEALTDSANRTVKLLRPLGKGGFGAVYLADVRSPEGLVQRMAVKVLHGRLAEDPAMEARAKDEARVMSLLNHDHVVKIHALTEVAGRSAVLMEYVEGIDGDALIEASRSAGDGGLPLTVACAIVERAASALDAAWSTVPPGGDRPLHIVHRDIKPSNLIISVSGGVKVLDFGVARGDFEREAHTRAMTQAAQMGTRRYMSPERWLVQRCEPPADVYALGVSFYELLTGERFEPLPLEASLYAQRLDGVIASLTVLCADPAVAEKLEELLRGMLAWDPDLRPTAAQVDRAMAELTAGVEGPSLRRFARDVIPMLLESQTAQMQSDHEVREFTNSLVRPKPGAPVLAPPPAPARPSVAGVAVGAALVVVLGVGGALAFLGASKPGEPGPALDPGPGGSGGDVIVPEQPAEKDPLPEPEPPIVLPEEKPTPVEPTPRPAPPPRPTPTPVNPKPDPVPVDPTPAPLDPEPVPVPVEPPARAASAASATIRTVKVLSDPIQEKFSVDGKEYVDAREVPIAVGRHDLVFTVTMPGESAARGYPCTVNVTETTSRIKFIGSERSCFTR